MENNTLTLCDNLVTIMASAADSLSQTKPIINALCMRIELQPETVVLEVMNYLLDGTKNHPEKAGMNACWNSVRQYIREYFAGRGLVLKLKQTKGAYVGAEWHQKNPTIIKVGPSGTGNGATGNGATGNGATGNGATGDAGTAHTKSVGERVEIALRSINVTNGEAIEALLRLATPCELLSILQYGADLALADLDHVEVEGVAA